MSENILVTGFGPFRDHKINASWEAVKLLPEDIDGYKIVKKEIAVTYYDVQTKIPALWKELNPALVVHIGVSSFATQLTLEKCANRIGYIQTDCSGKCHSSGEVCCTGEDRILTDIDVKAICDLINCSTEVKACTSDDAGRYLCEFIYYTSLSIDRTKTLFIHVPCLDQPYSANDLANGISEIIKNVLLQIRENCKCYNHIQAV